MAKKKVKVRTKARSAAKPKARAATRKKRARSVSSSTTATKRRAASKSKSSAPAAGKKTKKSTRATRTRAARRATTKTSAGKTGPARSNAAKTSPAKTRTPKRSKPPSGAAGGNHNPRAGKRPRSSRLSPEDLVAFRDLLLAKRAELAGDVTNLREEAMRRGTQTDDHNLSNMPTHMADLGSDNWEQEFTLGLLDKDMALLKEIDDALERITDGTYGLCLATEKPIGKRRLRAKPWAKYCIEYAEMLEKGQGG